MLTIQQVKDNQDKIQERFQSSPLMICNVKTSQFSIARHYGGIKYNGVNFTYNPTEDTLIRDELLIWARKNIK